MDNDKVLNFNVLGCCVSRDTLDLDRDKYHVQRYSAFISPFTMLNGTVIDVPDRLLIDRGAPGFAQKVLTLDANKKSLEYVLDLKSDWLLFDIADIRMGVVEWKEQGVILTYNSYVQKYLSIISHLFGDVRPKEYKVFDLPQGELFARLNGLLKIILDKWSPNEIILNEFYCVYDFLTSREEILSFASEEVNKYKEWNKIIRAAIKICEEKLEGCHIIKAPDHLLATVKHKWGLSPLHYHKLYYEYSEKAISIITQEKLDRKREEEKLENLRLLYSEKFAALREKAEATSVRLDRDKWRNYSNTFKSLALKNLLLPDKSAALSLQNAFLSKGYTHIAIYGDTEITKILVHILRGTSVTVDYIIENAAKPVPDVRTINRNSETYPAVDLLLIADIYYYEEIKAKLEKREVAFPFVNAAEFIQSLPAGQGIGELQAYVNSLKEKQADLEENVAQLQKSAEAYAAEKAQMQAAFGELSDRYQASEQKAADLATEVDGLQVKNKAAQRDIEELSVENKAAKEEIEGLHRKQTEAQKQIVAITSQRDAAVADAASLRNSVSYKFGRAMTFIPRKIRDVFKKK